MAIGGKSTDIVTKWVLNADQYKTELAELSKTLKAEERHARNVGKAHSALAKELGVSEKSARTLSQTLGDLKASYGKLAIGVGVAGFAVTKLIQGFDHAMVQGRKFQGLMQAQQFSVAEASRELKGMVGDFDLITAANRGVALGLDINAKSIAKISKAAAVAAQTMGTDVTSAINDIMTGLGRQSPMILDNLGITVKAEGAYKAYAESVGKVVSELTESEKKIAFQTAALAALNETASKGGELIGGYSAKWAGLKTAFKNVSEAFPVMIANIGKTGKEMGIASKLTTGWSFALNSLARSMKGVKSEAEELQDKLQGVLDDINSLARGEELPIARKKGPTAPANVVEHEVIKPGKKKRRAKKKDPVPGLISGALNEDRGVEGLAKGVEDAFKPDGKDEKEGFIKEYERRVKMQEESARMFQTITDRIEKNNEAVRRHIMHQKELQAIMGGTKEKMQELAWGGVATLAEGFADATQAAIESGESMAKAMKKVVKAVLWAIAKMAIVEAIMQLAQGIKSLAMQQYDKAGQHFAAMGVFIGVAALAGAGAAAISGGGGKQQGAGVGAGGGAQARREAQGPKESFGSFKKRDKQEVTVNVWLGEGNDPSAGMLMRRQVSAQAQAAGI